MTAVLDTRPVFALEIRTVDAGSPGRARRWLAWVLETARVAQDVIDSAVLAVSELATNALLHTDSPRILVSAEVVDVGVRLVVHDDQDDPAQDLHTVETPGGLAEHGRGLILVRALAADLRVEQHQHGTTITALIPGTRP